MNRFNFFWDKLEILPIPDAKIVTIDKNIGKRSDLFNSFSSQLNFPLYFGDNWDALYDCLSDLSWVNECTIMIIHDDIPFETMIIERKTYLDLLSDLITNWQDNKIHCLNVYFPKKCEREIQRLLKDRGQDRGQA